MQAINNIYYKFFGTKIPSMFLSDSDILSRIDVSAFNFPSLDKTKIVSFEAHFSTIKSWNTLREYMETRNKYISERNYQCLQDIEFEIINLIAQLNSIIVSHFQMYKNRKTFNELTDVAEFDFSIIPRPDVRQQMSEMKKLIDSHPEMISLFFSANIDVTQFAKYKQYPEISSVNHTPKSLLATLLNFHFIYKHGWQQWVSQYINTVYGLDHNSYSY